MSCKGSFLEMECHRPNIFFFGSDLAIWKIRFGKNLHSFKKMLVFQTTLQQQGDSLLNIRGFKVKHHMYHVPSSGIRIVCVKSVYIPECLCINQLRWA